MKVKLTRSIQYLECSGYISGPLTSDGWKEGRSIYHPYTLEKGSVISLGRPTKIFYDRSNRKAVRFFYRGEQFLVLKGEISGAFRQFNSKKNRMKRKKV